MFGMAAGAQLSVWRGMTLDLGFRTQGFFGDEKATRNRPYVAIGVSF